ncbi:MAG: DUF6033 family protein [Lachnospiraceae bacterium]|nr:DUF6033 family protein [Lachnospiraceae bacterium]
MAGINEISAYTQVSQAYNASKSQSDKTSNAASSTSSAKKWSSISSSSSLVPKKTDYGFTIGDVKLSETAAKYYEELKSKFHNMEFIAVSKDMKSQAQANAASYGNANKMVVLLDEEKLEKMATDENFRKKYEGIISSASAKLTEAKNSLTSSGANVANFGMSVDSNGNESFFATVKKSLDQQQERIEKNAEKKKAEKAKEKAHAQEKLEEKRAERKENQKELQEKIHDKLEEKYEDIDIIEADSMESLLSKVTTYAYNNASNSVMTEAEMALGNSIDFKG